MYCLFDGVFFLFPIMLLEWLVILENIDDWFSLSFLFVT